MYARHVSFGFGSWNVFVARWTLSLLRHQSTPLSHRALTTVTLFYLPRQRKSRTSCSTFKMLQHVWSLGPGSMSVVCLGWCTMTYTDWLFLSECSTSLLWQSIVVFGTELQGISPTTVCQSLKLLVASTCDLPDVINCQFREFAAIPLGPVHFPLGLVHLLSPHQESGIHYLIICVIQLLTPNNLGETRWRICSLWQSKR